MDDPEQPKPVLTYRAPADDPLAAGWRALAFAAGAIPGTAIVLFFGLEWYFLLYLYLGSPRTRPAVQPGERGVPCLVFGLLAVAAGVGFVAGRRADRRRWVVLGLLAGVGLAALVEGTCFAAAMT